LHGDVARELRDAMRHALVVTHRRVGGKVGVNALQQGVPMTMTGTCRLPRIGKISLRLGARPL